jgi:hypothetical protein
LMRRFTSLRRHAAPSLLERAPPLRVMRRDIGQTPGARRFARRSQEPR